MSVLAHNNIYNEDTDAYHGNSQNQFLLETEIAIADLMKSPMETLQKIADERKINLSYEATNIKIIMKVDEEKIRHSILHVVQNALNFSVPSSTVYVVTGRDFHGDAYIRVDDEGVGIAEDVLERILEPFTKVENGIESRGGQNACGLNLVNSYLKMHFGYLRIQSQVKRGTSVTLTLPKSCVLRR